MSTSYLTHHPTDNPTRLTVGYSVKPSLTVPRQPPTGPGRNCQVSGDCTELSPDFTRAALIRPGTLADVARLQYLGARILHRGTHRDTDGAIWPCVVVRLGRLHVVIVLSADGGERAHHPPGAGETVERRAA